MAKLFELAQEHASISTWRQSGPERPVKVLSPAAVTHMKMKSHGTDSEMITSGYVTQEKYLLGKTCTQIESALGLRPLEIGSMCYVYSLQRLPTRDEVVFRWFCSHPGGKEYDDALHKKTLTARDNFAEGKNLYNRSHTPVVNFYQPGSPTIPQWELTADIPVGRLIAVVTKTNPF